MNNLLSQQLVSLARNTALAIALTTSQSRLVAEPAFFQGLGDLSGGNLPDNFASQALAVSADGTVVVGLAASESGKQAFRWTADEGMVGLGDLPGGNFDSVANAVSADGTVIVGFSSSASSGLFFEAFRWTSSGGMVGLGDIMDGAFDSRAYGISADGAVVVGRGRRFDDAKEAFRWSLNDTMIGLGGPVGANQAFQSVANAASADGSIVVGGSIFENGYQAFRWRDLNGNGHVDVDEKLIFHPEFGLGDLDGGNNIGGEAKGVSPDGNVVVGQCNSASGGEAFRWTANGGMIGLGDLPGNGFASTAKGVSADGTIVVGIGSSPSGNGAFLWDQGTGCTRSLRDVLVNDFGLDLTGWTLESANAVTTDGLTVVGNGINPERGIEAWIAHLPHLPTGTSGTCDVDRDGFVDGRDIPPMIAAVLAVADDQQTLCAVDLDASGVIDPADLPLFVDCLLAAD